MEIRSPFSISNILFLGPSDRSFIGQEGRELKWGNVYCVGAAMLGTSQCFSHCMLV